MAKLPQLNGAEVVRRLKRLGMEEDHCRGSHLYVRNPVTGNISAVPQHRIRRRWLNIDTGSGGKRFSGPSRLIPKPALGSLSSFREPPCSVSQSATCCG